MKCYDKTAKRKRFEWSQDRTCCDFNSSPILALCVPRFGLRSAQPWATGPWPVEHPVALIHLFIQSVSYNITPTLRLPTSSLNPAPLHNLLAPHLRFVNNAPLVHSKRLAILNHHPTTTNIHIPPLQTVHHCAHGIEIRLQLTWLHLERYESAFLPISRLPTEPERPSALVPLMVANSSALSAGTTVGS